MFSGRPDRVWSDIRCTSIAAQSLQRRVLGFGLRQDGDVGIGVFPEGEEIFVGGASLVLVTCEYVGASKLQMCQCAYGFADHNPAMVKNSLELHSGFPPSA